MEPLVSILIPAYNAEPWIAEAIESAIGQTWRRKEIIIVDDGSSDNTVTIAQKFASKEVCIRPQPHQGASTARNHAFSVCQGDYIQWLDADDILSSDKISRQIEALKRCKSKRTLLSSEWGHFMYRPSKARFVPTTLWCDLSPVEWMMRRMEHGVFMQTGSWLVSRELIEGAGLWDHRLLGDDDGEYFCRVVLVSDGVHFIPESRVFWRRAGFNRLSYVGDSDVKLEAQLLSMKLTVGHVLAVTSDERARAACLTYLRSNLLMFYPRRLDIVRELQALASTFGCHLSVPALSWKYSWMQKAFGWNTAKRAQLALPKLKMSAAILWDKTMFHAGTMLSAKAAQDNQPKL